MRGWLPSLDHFFGNCSLSLLIYILGKFTNIVNPPPPHPTTTTTPRRLRVVCHTHQVLMPPSQKILDPPLWHGLQTRLPNTLLSLLCIGSLLMEYRSQLLTPRYSTVNMVLTGRNLQKPDWLNAR